MEQKENKRMIEDKGIKEISDRNEIKKDKDRENLLVDDRMLEKLEILAQLELSPEERQQVVGNLNRIVDYFGQIKKADADSDNWMDSSQMQKTENPLRQDIPAEADSTYASGMLDNTQRVQDHMIVVPRSFT